MNDLDETPLLSCDHPYSDRDIVIYGLLSLKNWYDLIESTDEFAAATFTRFSVDGSLVPGLFVMPTGVEIYERLTLKPVESEFGKKIVELMAQTPECTGATGSWPWEVWELQRDDCEPKVFVMPIGAWEG